LVQGHCCDVAVKRNGLGESHRVFFACVAVPLPGKLERLPETLRTLVEKFHLGGFRHYVPPRFFTLLFFQTSAAFMSWNSSSALWGPWARE
jgi:hypothetical protein